MERLPFNASVLPEFSAAALSRTSAVLGPTRPYLVKQLRGVLTRDLPNVAVRSLEV